MSHSSISMYPKQNIQIREKKQIILVSCEYCVFWIARYRHIIYASSIETETSPHTRDHRGSKCLPHLSFWVVRASISFRTSWVTPLPPSSSRWLVLFPSSVPVWVVCCFYPTPLRGTVLCPILGGNIFSSLSFGFRCFSPSSFGPYYHNPLLLGCSCFLVVVTCPCHGEADE